MKDARTLRPIMQLHPVNKLISYVRQRGWFSFQCCILQDELKETSDDRGEAHESWERRNDNGVSRAGLGWGRAAGGGWLGSGTSWLGNGTLTNVVALDDVLAVLVGSGVLVRRELGVDLSGPALEWLP